MGKVKKSSPRPPSLSHTMVTSYPPWSAFSLSRVLARLRLATPPEVVRVTGDWAESSRDSRMSFPTLPATHSTVLTARTHQGIYRYTYDKVEGERGVK